MSQDAFFFNSLRYMRDNFDTMTKTERIIAAGILRNPSAVLSASLKTVAKQLNVSEGSVVNFSKTLGFSGFSEMKLNLAQCVAPISRAESPNEPSAEDGGKKVVKSVLERLTAAFYATYDLLEEETFQEAAELLTRAQNVEIYGLASSAASASDAAYRMMQLGLPVKAVTDPLLCPISALALTERSVVVAISVSGKTRDLLRALNIARSQGAQIISVVCSASSPVARLSRIALITGASSLAPNPASPIDNPSNEARIAQAFLIEALCVYVAALRREEALLYQKKIEDIRTDYNLQ